jgi:hypothetical protein
MQQSKKEFLLTGGAIVFDLFHVNYPEGAWDQNEAPSF